MPAPTAPPESFDRIAQSQAAVAREYQSLTQALSLDSTQGQGGKLLYAGDLAPNANLLRAANIAGAASLAASSDAEAARSAMREGVIDFLVTSLDEALRILKNEIRKHQPVSVAVTEDPAGITRQMLDRGVQPDLLASQLAAVSNGRYLFWSADRVIMPRLDGQVHQVLAGNSNHERWLRLAPRYLGRAALTVHGILLEPAEAAGVIDQLKAALTESEEGSAHIGLL